MLRKLLFITLILTLSVASIAQNSVVPVMRFSAVLTESKDGSRVWINCLLEKVTAGTVVYRLRMYSQDTRWAVQQSGSYLKHSSLNGVWTVTGRSAANYTDTVTLTVTPLPNGTYAVSWVVKSSSGTILYSRSTSTTCTHDPAAKLQV